MGEVGGLGQQELGLRTVGLERARSRVDDDGQTEHAQDVALPLRRAPGLGPLADLPRIAGRQKLPSLVYSLLQPACTSSGRTPSIARSMMAG